MVCVSFCVICIVEILVSSVICRFQGLSYSHVPECIEFSFILFVHHNIHFYFELCTYCNILDIYLSWNMNSVKYLFYMELLNYLFCDMFGGILECYELTHVLPNPDHKTDMHKQRVLMHRHQGLNVRHGLCHIYMRYLYIYIYELFIAFVCFVVCS